MKLKKNNTYIGIASFIGSTVAGILDLTVKPIRMNYKPEITPAIYALWHGRQVGLGIFRKRERKNINILISQSNDGQIITNVCKFLGFKIIRGSHKRGGTKALIEILSKLKKGKSIAYTIDGPRGPVYKVKVGLIKISQMSQMPIIPMVADVKHKITFNSWDKYMLPLPFTTMVAIYGDPIYVPKDADDEKIEEYRLLVENKLFELQELVTKELN